MKKLFVVLALLISAALASSCLYEEHGDYMFDVKIRPSSLDMTWKYDAYNYIYDACVAAGVHVEGGYFFVMDSNKKAAYQIIKKAVNKGMDEYDAKPAGIEDMSGGEVVVTDELNGGAEVMRRHYKNKFE